MGSQTKADIKREKFAVKFFSCMNGREAALFAGVKNGRGLDTQVSRLLSDVKVRRRLEELKQKAEEKIGVTKERVLEELAIIGLSDIADYAEVLEGSVVKVHPFSDVLRDHPKSTRAINKLKEKRSLRADNTGEGDETIIDVAMEFGLHDKVAALKEISKLLDYYPAEKQEVKHSGNVSYEIIDYSKSVTQKNDK